MRQKYKILNFVKHAYDIERLPSNMEGLTSLLRNSRPISAEVALPRLQSEIKVALFLFASHSFLANYLRFMVKLIDKAIVINVKIHKNERKGFYSSNKEGLIC